MSDEERGGSEVGNQWDEEEGDGWRRRENREGGETTGGDEGASGRMLVWRGAESRRSTIRGEGVASSTGKRRELGREARSREDGRGEGESGVTGGGVTVTCIGRAAELGEVVAAAAWTAATRWCAAE